MGEDIDKLHKVSVNAINLSIKPHCECISLYAFASRFLGTRAVLDIINGNDCFSNILACVADRVVSININQETICLLPAKGLRCNVEFRSGSVSQLPVAGAKIFDAITCLNEEIYLDGGIELFSEVNRLLKDDGLLIVSIPSWDLSILLRCDNSLSSRPNNSEFVELIRKKFAHIYIFVHSPGPNTWHLHCKSESSGELRQQAGQIGAYLDISLNRNSLNYVVVATNISLEERFDINGDITDVSNSLLAQFGEQFSSISENIQQLEEALFDSNNQIDSLTKKFKQATNSNAQLEKEIEEFRRSITWKFIIKYHNSFVEPLCPPGTRRRNMYSLCIKAGRILFNEGWHSLWLNLRLRYGLSLPPVTSKKNSNIFDITTEELTLMNSESLSFKNRPKISIIFPVWNTNDKWLRSAIDSVMNQVYDNWELCIVDDASTKPHIKKTLKYYQHKDPRIKVKFLDKNLGVAGASNEAISLSTGEYIGILDHDDEILPSALYEVVKLINKNPDADFIYSDEALITKEGKPYYACYRPNFSIDYLLSHCYIVHFVAVRSSILRKIGGFRREFTLSQDYDTFLRILSETRQIYHIPKILYKWRQYESSTGHIYKYKVMDLSRKAINDFLEREGIDAEAMDTNYFNFFRVKRKIIGNPKVTIIIPTKDRCDMLRDCIESIEKMTSYANYEVLILDHLSREMETKDYLDHLESSLPNYRVLKYAGAFNYSRMNNYAARYAFGEHLLFLNNDVKVKSPEWLEAMLEHSQREEVGCVGAKLLYPDNKIQHVGVVVGWGGRAEHLYKWYDSNDIGYMGHFISIRNYSAITAACMMVKKKLFNSIGGFDENLKVGFGDTDLCLRLQSAGYLNVYTPYATLYHYESATRGKALTGDMHEDDTRFFKERWQKLIMEGDPFYNPNLPLDEYDIRPYICL